MKRQTIEEYQAARREQALPKPTAGDEERKERVLEHGRGCLRRIKGDTTWEDWLGIGAALMVITEEALAAISVTVWNPDNKQLVREFNRLWSEYEASAAEAGANEKPLSKQERWAVREVMTNPQVGAWRATLDGALRRKLNHPNKVIERWKNATQVRDTEPRKPQPSMSQALSEKNKVIAELEARNAELAEERPKLTLDDIINALVEMWQDQPASGLEISSREFNKLLRERMAAVWKERRKAGIPTESEAPKKKGSKRARRAIRVAE